MAMVVDQTVAELELSGYSTTTTTTTTIDDEHGCNWNDWSPMVDWDAISGSHDDFHDLVKSMMDDNVAVLHHDHHHEAAAINAYTVVEEAETSGGDDSKGLRSVHLLMAAAEALTGVNKSRDLARVILVRLKELVSPSNGSNMERLAARFAEALLGSLEGSAGGVHSKHMLTSSTDDYHPTDAVAAFQLLQDMSPYIKFGHFTANQAILEAVAHDRRVHIVDYDIMEGIQWASLMQALVSRKDGPPAPHLRITAVTRGGGSGRQSSIGTVQETGRRLTAFAASIGQPFSFHQCRLDLEHEAFRPSALKLVRGEALLFNCMLHLPHFNHRAPESVTSFLNGAKVLNPRLVTLVEEEVGPTGDRGFVNRFMDLLHHYSALYDSLETGFSMQGRARALVERVFLSQRISGSLAGLYRSHGEEESCSWGEWLAMEGFRPLSVSFANHCQAKLLLGLFNDGYRVEELGNNRLVLGWKSRRLLSASIWTNSDSDL
ncbi:protein NODULATION SIGNALING PATHWAY 2 [Rhododendron vialii]|uniref:protein NODULATION SIGNALING PATHWAY 2 n=1 Tax=Rhododendron vialii TaxID=182163 RepID=UPI00265E95A8|nr:protein NODULATION SIGNALING PATHWAY 2 [Rhododendron vialii]